MLYVTEPITNFIFHFNKLSQYVLGLPQMLKWAKTTQ